LGFPDLDPYGFSTLRIWDLRIWTFTDLVIYGFGTYGFGFTDLGLTDLDLRICPGIPNHQCSTGIKRLFSFSLKMGYAKDEI